MEGIGSEVSHKIRDAIKAKLIELEAYVDDELPDYIMVMVANKRTRSQMNDDLQLFLRPNTRKFTSWLHTVLQKLQEVTVASLDGKKEVDSKKHSKRKRSVSSDRASKTHKSPDNSRPSKKHSKKHKESKKGKKNKHKSKERKSKSSGKKQLKENGSSDEATKLRSKETDARDDLPKSSPEKIREKKLKEKKVTKDRKLQLNEAVGKAILGDLKKNEKLKFEKNIKQTGETGVDDSDHGEKPVKNVTGSNQGSVSAGDDVLDIRADDEPENEENNSCKRSKGEVVEDEFNIEPLKPIEKVGRSEADVEADKTEKDDDVQIEATTIRAPTKELLKEHDKILSQSDGEVPKEKAEDKKKPETDSDGSMSPEEIRRQLLLSRTKKKLEESKMAERMKSNSPDVLILEETNATEKPNDPVSVSRSPQITRPDSVSSRGERSPVRSRSRTRSPVIRRPSKFSSRSSYSSNYSSRSDTSPRRKVEIIREAKLTVVRSANDDEGRKVSVVRKKRGISPITFERVGERTAKAVPSARSDRRRNAATYSERNISTNDKKEQDSKKLIEKVPAAKKKPISSRVVTIPEPDVPEISSIVKVKPREFISKDKQANKALILKAVADAQKSIAGVPSRNDSESDIKKPEALFTKNLRGKRYEKLAVTLSNVRSSPDFRDRSKRTVALNSDHSDGDEKADSLHRSDHSQGEQGKPDARKKTTGKSDDHFISSKTTIIKKNDNYIRCWLEGVQKAVKDEEIVNPDDIESFEGQKCDEQGKNDVEFAKPDAKKKKKRKSESEEPSVEDGAKPAKLTGKDVANLRLRANSPDSDDGPQIVVTLDGLNTKVIKDIFLKNRETPAGPILTSSESRRSSEKYRDSKEIKYVGEKIETNIKIAHRNNNSPNRASTSGIQEKSPSDSKKQGFERISDRFGRINKTSENHEYKEKYHEFERERYEKKIQKYQGTEKEKYYEQLRDKFAPPGESKNKKLIAQLSEKFGKVDREFENKKRKSLDDEKRYTSGTKRGDRDEAERDGKYKKGERKSLREGTTDYEGLRRMKSKERCMFWPDCSKGSKCEFHHPTSPCKLLPNCKYKEKCMYIHPPCKNDLQCHEWNCPYEHSSDRLSKTTSPKERKISSPPPHSKFPSSTSTCKFYPNCKNLDCRYFHPKKCRYDDDCTNPDCKYIHSDRHQKKRPKWSSKS